MNVYVKSKVIWFGSFCQDTQTQTHPTDCSTCVTQLVDQSIGRTFRRRHLFMGVRMWGQIGSADPPRKMDEKLKSENMQKGAIFYVNVIF